MFNTMVWMIEEQVTAELVSLGAFSSRVKFSSQGIEYDEIVMNEDFIPLEDLGIEYESLEDEKNN
jgi:hypothetical protein